MRSRSLAAAILSIVAAACCGCGGRPRPADPIGHYVEGVVLADAGKFEAALLELSMAVADDPELSVAYAAAGDIYFKRGHLSGARDAYSKACRANPYSFSAQYKLGLVCWKLVELARSVDDADNLLSDAVGAYLRSLEIEPDDYDANINISACYFQLGKYRLAEQYCKAAIRIKPDSAGAYSNMGAIYDSQNRLYDAIRWYKMSLELDSKQPELLLNLASTYMRQKRWKPALNACAMVAEQQPKRAAPWVLTGICYKRWGQEYSKVRNAGSAREKYARAAEAFERAMTLNPNSHTAYRNLGVVYMLQFLYDRSKIDLRDKAVEAWHRSLEIKSNQPDLRKLVKKFAPGSL